MKKKYNIICYDDDNDVWFFVKEYDCYTSGYLAYKKFCKLYPNSQYRFIKILESN